MHWLKLGLLNVGRNKRRSLAAILITSIATAGILSAMGFALFTYQSLQEFAIRTTGNVVLSHPDYFQKEENLPMDLGVAIAVDKLKALQNHEQVKAVLPHIQLTGLISNGEKSTIFMGRGVQHEDFYYLAPTLSVDAGKVLSVVAKTSADAEVMLGKGLAKSLNAQVGDELTLMTTTVDGVLNALDVVVRGIFRTGIIEVDKRALYLTVQDAQTLLMTDKVTSYSVYLYEDAKRPAVVESIKTSLPMLGVSHWQEQAMLYKSVKSLYNRLFGVMGFIVICMVAFSIYNAMSMTVVERTREIGTLRSLGAHPREIVRDFMCESAWIGVMGIALGGLMLGVVFVALILLDVQMPPPPGQTNGYPLRIALSLTGSMIVSAAVFLLCLFTAAFTSMRAINKPIPEALVHV